ncbi:MAG: Right origin-binding protein [Alphaproteobacteria bacterium ADurb.Bin438]|nr:MAG: Right origin-binding protein [Alphaproteobacteria bacterium ADurb.Bin438]
MSYIKKINKAIAIIENNLNNEELNIHDITKEVGISLYHFHRIFNSLIGLNIGEYIRKRKISRSAYDLTETNKRIIDIAIDYGYGSQEAFNRAFKAQFKTTPANYRKLKQGSYIYNKKEITFDYISHLQQGVTMEPKIIEIKNVKIIGMSCMSSIKNNLIPDLWNRFMPRIHEIENKSENFKAYGVCLCSSTDNKKGDFTEDTEFTEIAGVNVTSFDKIPEGMTSYEIEGGKYAVFTHKGALSNLRMTYDYIYGTWIAKTDLKLKNCDSFELYDERFNIKNQETSEFDIYVPIK